MKETGATRRRDQRDSETRDSRETSVLENISDSVVSLTTAKGSHCLDLGHSTSKDPSWLTQQRKAEFKIIKGWIADYNKRMLELKLTTASSASAVQISLSSLARLSVMALICFILARLIV
ncbi:hypothetical protein Syun_000628 [Stephania yunnanensis]|uniref:Uncharacterized protein n=1 Tax=Stephania yunnanensis TaxID=152371 RepID=A0AAP0Q6A7_9MAGN